MVTEHKELAAVIARPRSWFFWPKFATDQDVDAYLKSAKMIIYAAAGLTIVAGAILAAVGSLPSELGVAQTDTAISIAVNAAMLAALGYWLYRRRSRVLALLLLLTGVGQIFGTAAVGGRAGIGIIALLLIFGLGSLRATLFWHQQHPSAVRWDHVAIATVGAPATVLVTGVPVWIVVWILSGHDQDLANNVSGNVGILVGVAAAVLLTRRFPTTATAPAT